VKFVDFTVVVFSLLLLAMTGCHGGPEKAHEEPLPTASVHVQSVESREHPVTEDVVGTVRTRTRAMIEAKVPGRIGNMPITLGQRLEPGDLLVQLDVREIQARLDQALAVREQAERDLKRYRTLLNQGAVTQQEFDAVEARQRVADATVTEARAMLDYAQITAPFAGVITRKLAEVGDFASPGRPLLEIEGVTGFRFEADVPEALVTKVAIGGRIEVRIASLPDALDGTVSEISPASDPGSRTFLIKIDLPSDNRLRGGQFGRAAIPVGVHSVVAVPAGAVVQHGQMELVFVVNGDRAQMRLVRTGKTLGPDIVIIAGLSPGERVVIDGASRLRDGQPLAIGS
jgi:RND family efflux transporter MFP subunit